MQDRDPTPTVSVVIPLYNKRTTIARTLRSVFAQDFQNFEVIIVDDGSTDGSADVAVAVDPRVSVVRQANAGPGAARNRGLSLSRGEFVTFLDADDEWSPELLGTAVRILRKHRECGAFTADFFLQPQGVSRWSELGFEDGPWRLTRSTRRNEIVDCHAAFHSVTAVYRRQIALLAGGFYEERCTFGEDVPFWLRILLNNTIYRCDRPLGNYNMRDSELGVGARGNDLPVEPVLTIPEIVRNECPEELRGVLELWLAKHACRAAFMQLGRGHPNVAAKIVSDFPRMRTFAVEYIKIRTKLLLARQFFLPRHGFQLPVAE